MVLTATATEKSVKLLLRANCRVRADVLKLLHLKPPRLKTFAMSFNRPNLHYEIRYKSANEDAYPAILKMIRDFNSNRRARLTRHGNCNPISMPGLMKVDSARSVCGIIYAPRKVQCDNIAARLNSDGIMAASYHADLAIKDRERILNAWVDGEKLGVVVATLAFGMGVDRGDVTLHRVEI
jgi:superfamily II DNA helicase RecQ